MGIILVEAKSWQSRGVMEITRKKAIASTSWTMRTAVMSIKCVYVCLLWRKIARLRLGERGREGQGEKGESERDHRNEVPGMLMFFRRYTA